jgi:hypothetical protein
MNWKGVGRELGEGNASVCGGGKKVGLSRGTEQKGRGFTPLGRG